MTQGRYRLAAIVITCCMAGVTPLQLTAGDVRDQALTTAKTCAKIGADGLAECYPQTDWKCIYSGAVYDDACDPTSPGCWES